MAQGANGSAKNDGEKNQVLAEVEQLLADEHGLAVVSTSQADGRILSSVVNCGLVDHPLTGEPTVAFVSGGDAARLDHVRRGSTVTIAVRRGWKWRGITGSADLIGPDDIGEAVTADQLRHLLRAIFEAAGGTHDDYDTYDRVMAEERRTAVFVQPHRVLGNY